MKRMALGLACVGALALGSGSARAQDGWYGGFGFYDPDHESFHDSLDHRDFHRELYHREAHRYPMSWSGHERLHDDLEHDAFHDELRHRSYHRYRYGGYRHSYGGFGYYRGGCRPRSSFSIWLGW